MMRQTFKLDSKFYLEARWPTEWTDPARSDGELDSDLEEPLRLLLREGEPLRLLSLDTDLEDDFLFAEPDLDDDLQVKQKLVEEANFPSNRAANTAVIANIRFLFLFHWLDC